MNKYIPPSVMERLPLYLHFLNKLDEEEYEFISATKLAKLLNLGEVQVRKDLALVSGCGKPRTGYKRYELIHHLQSVLGTNDCTKAVIVGAGKLGKALIHYDGFEEYGYKIVAGFDNDPLKIDGKSIFPLEMFSQFCLENDIKIGIITVPEKNAQEICELMIQSNILGIWNFTPLKLKVPEHIVVKNENLASSLAVLSSKI